MFRNHLLKIISSPHLGNINDDIFYLFKAFNKSIKDISPKIFINCPFAVMLYFYLRNIKQNEINRIIE